METAWREAAHLAVPIGTWHRGGGRVASVLLGGNESCLQDQAQLIPIGLSSLTTWK